MADSIYEITRGEIEKLKLLEKQWGGIKITIKV